MSDKPTASKLESIKATIKKLLALSLDKGASEAEAMAAGALAAKLIARYGVEVAVETANKSAGGGGNGPAAEHFQKHQAFRGKGPFGAWQGILCDAITEGVKLKWIFYSSRTEHVIHFVGPLDECAMASDLLVWLTSEVRRLQAEASERGECPKTPEYARGGGRRFWNGWRTGCTTRIKKRMDEARKDMQKELETEVSMESLALGTTQAQERHTQKYALAVKSLEFRIARIETWLAADMKAEGARFRKVKQRLGAGDGFKKGYAAGGGANLNAAKKLTGG